MHGVFTKLAYPGCLLGYFTVPPAEVQTIAISRSAILSVCSKTKCPNFTKFSVLLNLWPWSGPFLTSMQYVMYFRFFG